MISQDLIFQFFNSDQIDFPEGFNINESFNDVDLENINGTTSSPKDSEEAKKKVSVLPSTSSFPFFFFFIYILTEQQKRQEQNRKSQRTFRLRQNKALTRARTALAEERIQNSALKAEMGHLQAEMMAYQKEKEYILSATMELCEAIDTLKNRLQASNGRVLGMHFR